MSPSIPLYFAIVELLEKKGPLEDSELLKILKKSYEDLTMSILNKELLKLEVRGMIRVSRLARDKRRIELVEKVEE